MIQMTSKTALLAAALTCCLLLPVAAWADFSGTVVGVIDGDTVVVLSDHKSIRVRLSEIDAPERSQPFGARAKQALSELVYRKQVAVIERGQDKYGRVIGTLRADSHNVNKEMVMRGFAWAYISYAKDPEILGAEKIARAERRGLWADPQAEPPWLYRRR